MLHLPHNLRLIRLLSRKTQPDFGEMFDATKAMIISYEKGKANPDGLFLSRVSQYSGVSENDLKHKKLKEEDIKIKKVEKVENKDLELPRTIKEHDLFVTIRELSESTNRHSIIDERNSRNIERLLDLVFNKLNLTEGAKSLGEIDPAKTFDGPAFEIPLDKGVKGKPKGKH